MTLPGLFCCDCEGAAAGQFTPIAEVTADEKAVVFTLIQDLQCFSENAGWEVVFPHSGVKYGLGRAGLLMFDSLLQCVLVWSSHMAK